MADDQKTTDNAYTLKFQIWEWSFRTTWIVIRSGFWLGIAYIAYLAVQELAGKTTIAQFIIKGFAERTGTFKLIAFFLLIVWALTERRLRRRKVRYLSMRLQECEKKIDPERSSSEIHETGKTHPRDMLP